MLPDCGPKAINNQIMVTVFYVDIFFGLMIFVTVTLSYMRVFILVYYM